MPMGRERGEGRARCKRSGEEEGGVVGNIEKKSRRGSKKKGCSPQICTGGHDNRNKKLKHFLKKKRGPGVGGPPGRGVEERKKREISKTAWGARRKKKSTKEENRTKA